MPGARRVLGGAYGALALLRRHRRAQIALLCVLLALPLLCGGWLWLRSSPLVAVEHVQVSGVHGPQAHEIDAALVAAARGMSTLEVSSGALRAAVAPYPVVRKVQTSARFPHGLRIHVVEQLPVAALTVGATRTAVAADGIVLGPALLSRSLPVVSGAFLLTPGERVKGSSLLAALAVFGAAPTPLERLVARAYTGPRGLAVAMRDGLLVYFGDASRPHAKWLSLARVLADPSSAGASYIDVRLPERPAAGFPGGVAPDLAAASAEAPAGGGQTASSESTVAALAAGLTNAVGGSPDPASGPESTSTGSPGADATTASGESEGQSASGEQGSGRAAAEAPPEASQSSVPSGG